MLFPKHSWNVEVNAMRAFGQKVLGSSESHDFILGSVQVGYGLTDTLFTNRFYRGTLELNGQIWAGVQDHPDSAYLVGINPGLRYHFDTRMSLRPYIGASVGIGLTDIGEPDLSTKFQFNEQVGAGVHWFFRDDWALNLEYRFIHLSNAYIEKPNRGVNSHMVVVGVMHRF